MCANNNFDSLQSSSCTAKKMSLRRFYIPPEAIANERPSISGDDAGHITRVLRLKPGDTVELFDGTGMGYRARILDMASKRVSFTVEETYALSTESPTHITLAQGVLKDRKMDDLIRQLTEIGIDCWMPFHAARSVPQPRGKRQEKRVARWEKIAIEAVKQCRRGCIPEIRPFDSLKAVLATSESFDGKLLFWEETNHAFSPPQKPMKRIMIIIGPEGGLDAEEVRLAKEHGFLTAGLGPRILRAETATLAAAILAQYCFGDLG